MSLRVYLLLAAAAGLLVLGGLAAARLLAPRLFDARQRAETATDAAVGAGLSVQGAQASAADLARHHVLVDDLTAHTHALELEAQNDPTADAPLPDAVRDRLRRHDDILCDARPALCPGRARDRAAGPAAPG